MKSYFFLQSKKVRLLIRGIILNVIVILWLIDLIKNRKILLNNSFLSSFLSIDLKVWNKERRGNKNKSLQYMYDTSRIQVTKMQVRNKRWMYKRLSQIKHFQSVEFKAERYISDWINQFLSTALTTEIFKMSFCNTV